MDCAKGPQFETRKRESFSFYNSHWGDFGDPWALLGFPRLKMGTLPVGKRKNQAVGYVQSTP